MRNVSTNSRAARFARRRRLRAAASDRPRGPEHFAAAPDSVGADPAGAPADDRYARRALLLPCYAPTRPDDEPCSSVQLLRDAADEIWVNSPMATVWTRRHATTCWGVAAFSLTAAAATIAAVALWWPPSVLGFIVAAAYVGFALWIVLRFRRVAGDMRRIHVLATNDALITEGRKGETRVPWTEVLRFEIGRSGERLGATQLSVYVLLRNGRRVELEALRVDGIAKRRSTKLAALEPYRDALEHLIP